MVIVLSAFAFVLLAREIVLRFRRAPVTPFEGAAAYLTVGCAIWIATAWALALPHLLVAPAIYASIAIAFIAAVWLMTRRPRVERARFELSLAAALPVAAWSAFVAWRSWIVPPLSHDALAYHLVKGALYARAHGFQYFGFLDPIVRRLPANYEMLLGWVLAAEWRDTTTEWLGVFFYLSFLVAAAALAERWWRPHRIATSVMLLLTAGAPVLLLHTGAHKNDLPTAFAMVTMLVWCGRWIATGERFALVLLILATGIGVGTKPQAALLALPLAACALWKARQHRLSLRELAVLACFGVGAFLMLGGVVYVHSQFVSDPGNAQPVATFGDWKNLWQGPWVLLAAPFARSAFALDVPWSEAPWFWRRYELYFSHLGAAFTIGALALLATPILWRRAGERRPERTAMVISALVALVAMLPVNGKPHGLYLISLPRYALFVVAVVYAATIVPLLLSIGGAAGRVVLGVAMVVFAMYAVDFAAHDVFVPWDYVTWARAHPGTRSIPFDPYRAASVADRHAGPRDVIAADAGFGAWLYPLFGADLQRPVIFLSQDATAIPDSARWVVIDRRWSMMWDDPAFSDLSQARRFLGRGRLKPEDLRLRTALLHDPRFEMVFDDRKTNQTVFERRAPNR